MAKLTSYTCDGCGAAIPNEVEAISMMGVRLPAIPGTTTRPLIDGVNLCDLPCIDLWVEKKLRPRMFHDSRRCEENLGDSGPRCVLGSGHEGDHSTIGAPHFQNTGRVMTPAERREFRPGKERGEGQAEMKR